MFLDEELEQIYQSIEFNHFNVGDKALLSFRESKLRHALVMRIADPQEGVQSYLNSLKQVDNYSKLFCKRHPSLDVNFFRNLIKENDPTGKIIKHLKW